VQTVLTQLAKLACRLLSEKKNVGADDADGVLTFATTIELTPSLFGSFTNNTYQCYHCIHGKLVSWHVLKMPACV
jgi:hypothetical protein